MNRLSLSLEKRLGSFNARKRAIDLGALFVTAPVTIPVGVAVYVATRLKLGAPAIFRQERLGFQGEVFSILKFRTMTNAVDEQGNLLPDAKRLTQFGTFLRKSSLDELPQLVNILKGDMSIVGPRPLFPEYRGFYTEEEFQRHSVRPGITGLAQTSGRNSLGWDERLAVDIQYVREASVARDFKILLTTVRKALFGSNVSVVASETGERLDVLRSYPVQNGLAIRRLEQTDIPKRVKWFKDQRVSKYMSLPQDITVETSKVWWKQVIADHSRKDLVTVETSTGQVVAMCGIRERGRPGFPELYLLVDPEQHGRAIGRTTMSLVHEWVETSTDYLGLSLSVTNENDRAVALYKSLGYEVVAGQEDAARFEMIWKIPTKRYKAGLA